MRESGVLLGVLARMVVDRGYDMRHLVSRRLKKSAVSDGDCYTLATIPLQLPEPNKL